MDNGPHHRNPIVLISIFVILFTGFFIIPNAYGFTIETIDTDGGFESSISIGTDGLPVIAYTGGLSDDLRVAKCGNPACSSGNVLLTVDSEGDVGFYNSIAIGNDGNLVIIYFDGTNNDLKFAWIDDFAESIFYVNVNGTVLIFLVNGTEITLINNG